MSRSVIKEGKVSTQNDKELLQCLCLAYFAESSNHRQENHEENFYSLVLPEKHNTNEVPLKKLSNEIIIRKLVRNHLHAKFPHRNLLQFISKQFNASEKGPANYRNKLRRVYLVTKSVITKNQSLLNNYYFLDSTSEFFQLVKNKTLQKIKTALNLPSVKIDIFSAIDVIFVKKNKLDEIKKDFADQFSSIETIKDNGLIAGKLYAKIFHKYIDDNSWYPISVKLPDTIIGAETSRLKLVSINASVPREENDIEIDPYIRFLAILLKYPSKTVTNINKLIDINFNKFDVNTKQNWKFPIEFNYNNITDPDLKRKILKHKLSFDLLILAAGSWNGMWNSGSLADRPMAGHFGGLTVSSFESIIKQHSEFDFIFKNLAKIRKDAFIDILKKYDTLVFKGVRYHILLRNANNRLVEQTILTSQNKKFLPIQNFFRFIENQLSYATDSISHEYKLNVINRIRTLSRNASLIDFNQNQHIDGHFMSAQMSYFLFMGGESLKLFFKKTVVLMLYGWITKKSLTVFKKIPNTANYYEMKNAIEGIIEDTQKNLPPNRISLTTPPHYILD